MNFSLNKNLYAFKYHTRLQVWMEMKYSCLLIMMMTSAASSDISPIIYSTNIILIGQIHSLRFGKIEVKKHCLTHGKLRSVALWYMD